MARSSVSSLQNDRGRPVRMAFPFLYGSLYNSLDAGCPPTYLYRSLQIFRGFPMTHLDIVQAQNFLRLKANQPAQRLRRQASGAALFLLLGGGYALYHANARPAAPEHAAAAAPVTV